MKQLVEEHRTLLGQLIRFGLVGGFVTGLYAIVYSPLAKFGIVTPQIANLAGYFVAMITGYVLHSRWSFKDHGARDNTARTTGRFFVVSLVSLGLNALFVAWSVYAVLLLHGGLHSTNSPLIVIPRLLVLALFYALAVPKLVEDSRRRRVFRYAIAGSDAIVFAALCIAAGWVGT